MGMFGMSFSSVIIFILVLVPLSAVAQVNDNGTWKEPTGILVNDNGSWKVAQEIHVNESGTWTLVYNVTLPGGDKTLSFSWDITEPEKMGPIFADRVASTAYALGDRIAGPLLNGLHAEAIVAGVSSPATEGSPLPAALQLKNGGEVIDNGNGTVSIPFLQYGALLSTGAIRIVGTTNYDGSYTLYSVEETVVTITAAYVPETIFSGFVAQNTGGPTTVDGTVTWQLKDYASEITGYNLYYNGQLLCSASGKTTATLTCNDIPFTTPASFHMTYTHAWDGESLASNTITYEP